MSGNNIQITIDKSAMDNIQKQFNALKNGGGSSAYRALMKVAFKIKSEAQLRLTGRGHIVTSRLKNSIFVKSKKMNDVINASNSLSYSDGKGKSYKSDLSTVSLNDNEFAVGTNVEYAPAIELGARRHPINSPVLIKGVGWRYIKEHPGYSGDSFLYWAMKNVNVMQSVAKDMQEDMKTGKFAR